MTKSVMDVLLQVIKGAKGVFAFESCGISKSQVHPRAGVTDKEAMGIRGEWMKTNRFVLDVWA